MDKVQKYREHVKHAEENGYEPTPPEIWDDGYEASINEPDDNDW